MLKLYLRFGFIAPPPPESLLFSTVIEIKLSCEKKNINYFTSNFDLRPRLFNTMPFQDLNFVF